MSDTPETDAAELIYDGIVASGYADADVCRKLERERDQARRELDIQLESIHFHMERVPVREHPLRADDAPLQDSGAEPQPLREGEPSDFCGAIRRMRDAEKERDEARKQLRVAVGLLSTTPQFQDQHPEEVLKFVEEAANE